MAAKHQHPFRTLVILGAVISFMYAGMAALQAWTPKLGLDLQGGTTITLTAQNSEGGGAVDAASLELARSIIQQRVDSIGVGESEVTIAGDRQIVVAVPNVQQDELVAMVGETAQLTFRQVIAQQPATGSVATKEPEATMGPSGSAEPSASPTAAPSESAEPVGLPTAPPPPPTPRPTVKEKDLTITEALAYQPTQQDASEFATFLCGSEFPDVEDQPLMSCDDDGVYKYLLGPVVQKGETLAGAQTGMPAGQLTWVVNLSFDGTGADQFAETTTAVYGLSSPRNQVAIVLDGTVMSAPRINTPITNGTAEISGSFTQQSASQLANVLKYGALPLTFETSSVDNVSATLGSDQLRAGIIAGLIGLGLVVLYAFLYYRGLGLVVISSLVVAAIGTYALVVLLGQALGLALNLPGIAGAIVAVGITADSFIIYFERIRDEVREGRTLRTAIETGWKKAKPTLIIADMVSLLSAVVLFLLAMGAVQGFAFMLGLTTLVDLAIVFFFTKPLMTILGRTEFFGQGKRFSGLEPEHMGVKRLPRVRVGLAKEGA